MTGALISVCASVIGAGEVLAFFSGRLFGSGWPVKVSHGIAIVGAAGLVLTLAGAWR